MVSIFRFFFHITVPLQPKRLKKDERKDSVHQNARSG